MKCSKCDGEGMIYIPQERWDTTKPIKQACSKCNGAGELDWVENIVGKAPEKILHLTAKNKTNYPITIQDIGIQLEPNIEYHISEILNPSQILSSNDLDSLIKSGDVVIIKYYR